MNTGILASSGIAIGKAFLIVKKKMSINKSKIFSSQKKIEIQKFITARKKTFNQIKDIKEKMECIKENNKNEIFEGHLLLLEDEELEKDVIDLINNKLYFADTAVSLVMEKQINSLESISNNYLKSRVIDIKDIRDRLISNLLNKENCEIEKIKERVILIAKDLTPSEVARIDLKKILGFVTDLGSINSHSSIIARSLEIPAIVGVMDITKRIKSGDILIVDGLNNEIIINPSKFIIEKKQNLKKEFLKRKQLLFKYKNVSAVTIDKKQIRIGANINNLSDIDLAKQNGAECIGLYRTEFLFMGRDNFPSEEEQFQAYKSVIKKMNGKSTIIRTMDIGGDKDIPYMNLPKEVNPFLGWRAIRIGMDKKEILDVQIRAILRSSIFGKVKVMFPMIISIEEVQILKEKINQLKWELSKEKRLFDKNIEVGVMIETPSAAVISSFLAKEVDFFSIGTNDLTQYTLAVDRGNELISHLYNPTSLSVLMLIKKVIDASHEEGKWTGICGELAGDSTVTKLLIGMGVDELSMSAPSIPIIKKVILNTSFESSQELATKALSLSNFQEFLQLISNS